MKITDDVINNRIDLFENKLLSKVDNLNAEYGNLLELLELDDKFDDPTYLMKLLDVLPSIIAYYSLLHNTAKSKSEKLNNRFNRWKSKKEMAIKNRLFESNQKKGMTANNAKPTASDVNNYFTLKIEKTDEYKQWIEKINKSNDTLEKLKMIKYYLDNKKELGRSINTLLNSCINSGIIVPTVRPNKKLRKFKTGKTKLE